jgi:NADP-dependent 3-hydroxy acid dehydrogenase YdfG
MLLTLLKLTAHALRPSLPPSVPLFVQLVVNNAGIMTGLQGVKDVKAEDMLENFQVNAIGALHGRTSCAPFFVHRSAACLALALAAAGTG